MWKGQYVETDENVCFLVGLSQLEKLGWFLKKFHGFSGIFDIFALVAARS